ncbi:MAG TPA: carboxypeptidase-like regulatory domain-containing protein [Rectinemataceae bacterium]|nr:carboxypeptidase-like regulatory domain-containing protein [Rectinemataceae bacterium]
MGKNRWKERLRAFRSFLLTVCLAAIALFPAIAQTKGLGFAIVEPNEDELLLCSFSVERETLSQELETYVIERSLYLPLGAICRLIECGLDVDSGSGIALGYLWDEAHTFSLDMAARRVDLAGKRAIYDEGRIEAHSDDIYVEASLLSEWFGMPIQADRYDAAITVWPQTKLPIQLRLERDRRGGKTENYDVMGRSYYPRAANPYHFLDGFNLDFSLGSFLSSSDGEPSQAWSTCGALLTGDIFWMSGSIGFSGKLEGSDFLPTSLYGLLRRMDSEGTLLGPLRATEMSLGKVQAVLPSLMGASASGYGVAVGNYSLTSPSCFDLQTLSGSLLPGWDVELYRNGCYLDHRKADASGTYTFADIPLLFGTNVLGLEFHGPLGQKKSEEQVYSVGSTMTLPGTFSYRVSATAENEGGQFAFQTTYGLSKYLTITASALSVARDDIRDFYVQGGLAGYFSRLQFDAAASFETGSSGFAGELGLRTQVLGLGFSWRGAYYDRSWERADASYGDPPYLARSVLRADGFSMKIGGLLSSLSTYLTSTLYSEGDLNNSLTLRQYNSYRNFRLRNVLGLYHYVYASSARCVEAEGSSTANLKLGNVNLEASCDYVVYPNPALESLSLSAEAMSFLSIQVSGSGSYDFSTELLSASISLCRDLSPFRLGLSGTWTTQESFSVSLSLSTSIALDARSNHVTFDSQSRANQGSISALVYLDTNYDKNWSEGEKLLEGVGFIVNEGGGETVTDELGRAILSGISPNVPVNVSIDESTLEDILTVPADKGLSCVLHPGTAARMDFPIWVTGEISGTVRAMEGNSRKAIAGVLVEVLDSSGSLIASARSAYDGYFAFSALKVGTYSVRVASGGADAGVSDGEREVFIPLCGGYVDGIDLECSLLGEMADAGGNK